MIEWVGIYCAQFCFRVGFYDPARERMSPAESILTFPYKLNFPRELHSGRIDFVRACRGCRFLALSFVPAQARSVCV